jgi:hypothetical protein
MRGKGELADIAALAQALDRLVQRHEFVAAHLHVRQHGVEEIGRYVKCRFTPRGFSGLAVTQCSIRIAPTPPTSGLPRAANP